MVTLRSCGVDFPLTHPGPAIQSDDQSAIVDEILSDDGPNIHRLSLRHTLAGRDPEQQTAFSEIYPPLNFVKAVQSRQPELLEKYRCLSTRRAAVRTSRDSDRAPVKLIEVEDVAEELYHLAADPKETNNLIEKHPAAVATLDQAIGQMVQRATRERDAQPAGAIVDIEGDERLRQRLRGLGYME